MNKLWPQKGEPCPILGNMLVVFILTIVAVVCYQPNKIQDYRVDQKKNICKQTEEQLNGLWIVLDENQSNSVGSLDLEIYNKNVIFIGGVLLWSIGEFHYEGSSPENVKVEVTVEVDDSSILYLQYGDLNYKQYKCTSI